MNSNFPSAQNVAFSWQASWFVLSALCVLNGLYVEAEYFSRNLLDAGPLPGGLMFIGAEINLATVALRRGEADVARDLSARFFELLEHSDHMYRNSMRAVAGCVLGDVELRYGSASAALAAYRSAWHIVQEHPTMMAHHRISVRALAGLASAFIFRVKHFQPAEARKLISPFPFPLGESRGGRVPPTPEHVERQHTTLAHIMLSAPPTRGLRPFVHPPRAFAVQRYNSRSEVSADKQRSLLTQLQ